MRVPYPRSESRCSCHGLVDARCCAGLGEFTRWEGEHDLLQLLGSARTENECHSLYGMEASQDLRSDIDPDRARFVDARRSAGTPLPLNLREFRN